MDLSYFLSSLPFIIPLDCQSWPPRPPTTTRTSKTSNDNENNDAVSAKTSSNNVYVDNNDNNDNSNGITTTINIDQSVTNVLLGEVDKYNRSFFLSVEITKTNGSYNHDDFNAAAPPSSDHPMNATNIDNSTTAVSIRAAPQQENSESNSQRTYPAFFAKTNLNEHNTGNATNNNTSVYDNNNNDIQDDVSMTNIQIAIEDRIVTKIKMETDGNNDSTTMSFNNINKSPSSSYHHRRTNPNTTTPTRQKLDSSSVLKNSHTSPLSILYVKIRNHVYAIDICQLRHLEIIPEVYRNQNTSNNNNNESDCSNSMNDGYLHINNVDDDMYHHDNYSYTSSATRIILKPPSLVLHFDCVMFRIFSFRYPNKNGGNNNTIRPITTTNAKQIPDISMYRTYNDIREENETLQVLYDRIKGMQQQSEQSNSYNNLLSSSVVPLLKSDVISPRSSTTHGSSSTTTTSTATPLGGGQNENAGIIIGNDNAIKSPIPESSTNESSSDSNDKDNTGSKATTNKLQDTSESQHQQQDHRQDDVELSDVLYTERIKRRKMNQCKFHDNLMTIQHILDLPSTIVSKSIQNIDSSDDVDVEIMANQPLAILSPPAITTAKTTSAPPTAGSNRDMMISLTPLLNKTAKLRNRSYVTSKEFVTLQCQHAHLVRSNQNEMEQLLNAFFPTPPITHRNNNNVGRSSREAIDNETNERLLASPSPDNVDSKKENAKVAVLQNFENLLLKHGKLMTEQYKQFMMSIRG